MGGPVRGSPGRPLLASMPETHLDTGKESPWRELQQLAGFARQSMFRPLCFVENTVTDTQVCVCVCVVVGCGCWEMARSCSEVHPYPICGEHSD